MISLLTAVAAAATLSGTVRGADGSPIAGATVQLWDSSLSGVDTTSDADGTFTFTDVAPGSYRARATPPWRDNHVTRFLPDAQSFCESDRITVSGDQSGIDFSLPEGATLSGRVLAADGSPLVGHILWALGATPETEGWGRPSLSDSEGAFTVWGLDSPASGDGDHILYLNGDGLLPDQFFGPTYDDALASRVLPEPGGDRALDDWITLPGITVSGTVTGPGGPIENADVHVYASSQVVTVQTDALGRYTATGIPPGEVLAWASPFGHALTYFPDTDRPVDFVTVPNEGDAQGGVDLYPPLEAVLPLRLLGDGEPLPGVQVLLYNEAHTVGQGNRTDEAGEVRLANLFGGNKELYAWAGDLGFAEDWIRDADGGVATLVIEPGVENPLLELSLPGAASIAGTVTDEDGKALVGVTVVASRADGELVRAQSGEDGAYVLQGITPGDWELQASFTAYCPDDPGYVTAYHPGTINPDAVEPYAILADEAVSGLHFALPLDDDHDQMGDRWEATYGLDTGRDDSMDDPDGDSFPNLFEYRNGTDPMDPSTITRRVCACGGDKSALLLILGPMALLRRRRRRP